MSQTSTRAHNLNLSPPLRHARVHKKCLTADYPPFGSSRSCTLPLLEQIVAMIDNCKASLPSLSLQRLLASIHIDAFNSDFPAVGSEHNSYKRFVNSTTQINLLRHAAQTLSPAAILRSRIILHLKHHHALSSDNTALVILGNLIMLDESIRKKCAMLESVLWEGLDDKLEETVIMLSALMNKPPLTASWFDNKVAHVKLHDFRTLGVGCWLNDEVVNYFVDKWCMGSSTLGLNSFFAIRCLFNGVTGAPKSGILTLQDQKTVMRWCTKTASKQGLVDWDSVFIPINEAQSHWYSAWIDFRQKRIDIFDSLGERCLVNRKKPPLLRRNANLMLVLIWLTEVLGRIRGQEINFRKNMGKGWVFDPHFQVHFQPNSHDCGVHLLWHLRHLLEFRQIKLGDECQPRHLRFKDNMAGKRLRLAQEMLMDAGLA
ncbi:hypothetical protein D9757_007131 [Collybiopsis confluens]|uniref:Ubiquitin-like protease family profile domain-containing protein n=1 Tax=Collybiopsis confluens TaxID=2823264 RepID=A0A8H5LZ03_9AGAR|nr:hypothetical protein D9757_010186 [Collybiopsis confluens]KAF5379856.1 hypothetical protein D9757_007241 [Collybiopsis confluens]KAF5380797.1 hypothetical protein D9757_007131 [Collybiopsis confluens]